MMAGQEPVMQFYFSHEVVFAQWLTGLCDTGMGKNQE
jgi:hypothetical protein